MAQMSRRSIGVEIATVTLQPEQTDLLPEILTQLDEQVVAPEIRERLARNGFRAGVLGVQLPDSINLLLIEASDRRQHPTAESQTYADEQRFVQCRERKSVTAKIWGVRDLQIVYDNGEFQSTERLSQAESMFSVFGTPGKGGGIVRLLPEIAYGPIRQKYGVQDNAFHLEAKRDSRSFDDLAFELALRPGEVLMVTCNTWPTGSLGSEFFTNGERRKILLIRLAQTPVDEFFETGLRPN